MSKSNKSAKGRKQKLNFDVATDLVDNTVVIGSLFGSTESTPVFAGDVTDQSITALLSHGFSPDCQRDAFESTISDRVSNDLMNLLHVIRFDSAIIKNRWIRQLETLRRGWQVVVVIEVRRGTGTPGTEYITQILRPRHYEDISRLARAELSKVVASLPYKYEVITGGYLAETFRFKKQMLDLELMVDEAIKLLEASNGHGKN